MVRTAGKGSEAINRQGSTNSGGGRGRGRGGRGSRSPNRRAGGTRPSRPTNQTNPTRPIGGYLNALLGTTSQNTPARDGSGPSIPPGSDKRGLSFLLAAVDHIDPGNTLASAATTTAPSTAAAAASTSTAATPLVPSPDNGNEMGKIDGTTVITLPRLPEDEMAAAIATSPAPVLVAPPNNEGEAVKMAADTVIPPTSQSAPAPAPAPAPANVPDEEVEEGEIVENAVEEGEEMKFKLPDLNFPPPLDEL